MRPGVSVSCRPTGQQRYRRTGRRDAVALASERQRHRAGSDRVARRAGGAVVRAIAVVRRGFRAQPGRSAPRYLRTAHPSTDGISQQASRRRVVQPARRRPDADPRYHRRRRAALASPTDLFRRRHRPHRSDLAAFDAGYVGRVSGADRLGCLLRPCAAPQFAASAGPPRRQQRHRRGNAARRCQRQGVH